MTKKDLDSTLSAYDGIADQWSASRSTTDFWKAEHQIFKQLFPKGNILDIGCGTGRDSTWFEGGEYKYLGIDGSEAMLEIAKRDYPNAEFKIKNFYGIGSLKKEFQGFWAAASLLHVPKSRVNGVLKSIHKILLPGSIGFISLKEGLGEKEDIWPGTNFSRLFVYYKKEEFEKILNSCGFTVLEIISKLNEKSNSSWISYFVKRNDGK